MKIKLTLVALLFLVACNFSDQEKKNRVPSNSQNQKECDYLKRYFELGNKKMDTLRIGQSLVDPIDDLLSFKTLTFDFVQRADKLWLLIKNTSRLILTPKTKCIFGG